MKQSIRNADTGSVQVVKSATCPSLSGKSKLSYEVGSADGSEIQLRIVGNSAAGSFNRDWIDLRAVRSALEKAPRGTPLTSNALAPLFNGKSVNNQLFLFAVLVHEGFVRRVDGEKRGYERVDIGEFLKRTQALTAGKGAIAEADAKKKTNQAKSAPKTKRPAASTTSKKSHS